MGDERRAIGTGKLATRQGLHRMPQLFSQTRHKIRAVAQAAGQADLGQECLTRAQRRHLGRDLIDYAGRDIRTGPALSNIADDL